MTTPPSLTASRYSEYHPRTDAPFRAILAAVANVPTNPYDSVPGPPKDPPDDQLLDRVPDSAQTPPLEMAYVLFTDIVGYSRLPTDVQQQVVHGLQRVVRHTPEFQNAVVHNQLIGLPTGDGMALVFFGDPQSPVRCAVEVSQALRQHPEIKLRMGIHTGPVYRVADINANRNVAGGGINVAQRVMDCGDAGHILVSRAVAETLVQLTAWSQFLQDLGKVEVKHGVHVHIYNLHTGEAGNAELPQKLRTAAAEPQLTAVPVASPESKPSSTTPKPTGSSLDPSVLDSVSRELAAFIGPIAKMVVQLAADRCSSVDDLYSAVAVEIPSQNGRSRFMALKKKQA